MFPMQFQKLRLNYLRIQILILLLFQSHHWSILLMLRYCGQLILLILLQYMVMIFAFLNVGILNVQNFKFRLFGNSANTYVFSAWEDPVISSQIMSNYISKWLRMIHVCQQIFSG